MGNEEQDITGLLKEWQEGDEAALEKLSPAVYDELRRLAGRSMAGEGPGHTLQPTGLVHEAFMRLVQVNVPLTDRQHFFAIAARMMRRILVDHARAKRRVKRGGDQHQVTLNTAVIGTDNSSADILELDDALTKLAQHDPKLVEGVELIFFGGLSYDEAALELGVSRTRLVEDLKFAKTWLRRAMQGQTEPPSNISG